MLGLLSPHDFKYLNMAPILFLSFVVIKNQDNPSNPWRQSLVAFAVIKEADF